MSNSPQPTAHNLARFPIYFLTCLAIVAASAVVLAVCMFPFFIVHAMTVLK